MGSIFVNDRNGKTHKLEAQAGLTFMEIIRDAGLDIEAACGGCCACATCHIYVDKNWINKLPKMNDEEESMLDQAFNVKPESRLGCQIEFVNDYDQMQVELAPE